MWPRYLPVIAMKWLVDGRFVRFDASCCRINYEIRYPLFHDFLQMRAKLFFLSYVTTEDYPAHLFLAQLLGEWSRSVWILIRITLIARFIQCTRIFIFNPSYSENGSSFCKGKNDRIKTHSKMVITYLIEWRRHFFVVSDKVYTF